MRMVDAKSEAQKIAFSPLTFQAVRAALNLGIFKVLDDAGKDGLSLAEMENKLNLGHYAVSTLIEVLESAGIVSAKGGGLYAASKIVWCFLYDSMTRVNMDFVNDVCYQGAFYLQESFENGKPEGLKVFGGWPTVYQALSQLPQRARGSWFAFDHFYSDNAFEDVIKIILSENPENVFDVGCNTGKFELALFAKGFKGNITLLDLPQQLEKAKENLQAAGYAGKCVFYPIDILKKGTKFPGTEFPGSAVAAGEENCGSLNNEISETGNKKGTKFPGTKFPGSAVAAGEENCGSLNNEISETGNKKGTKFPGTEFPGSAVAAGEENGIAFEAAKNGVNGPDIILMSQFLDCFSKKEIILILKKAQAVMSANSKLYILEPFWDNQKFSAAKLSLTHTSLYFTAIANGNSKIYAQTEMEECVFKAGLKILKVRKNIGSHEYTLLECGK